MQEVSPSLLSCPSQDCSSTEFFAAGREGDESSIVSFGGARGLFGAWGAGKAVAGREEQKEGGIEERGDDGSGKDAGTAAADISDSSYNPGALYVRSRGASASFAAIGRREESSGPVIGATGVGVEVGTGDSMSVSTASILHDGFTHQCMANTSLPLEAR